MNDINRINNTPKTINREYKSATMGCQFECKYCFSKWGSIPSKTIDIHEDNKITVFYPLCDSELGNQSMHELETLVQERININSDGKKLIVSISTKDARFATHIPFLSKLHKAVSTTGGFVKLGVSFTNISYDSLEQGTASFEERITLLDILSKFDFKLSVVLKPILPFVAVDEYIKIVERSSNYVNNYLIGGLYVEKDNDFYNTYIKDNKDKYNATSRTVAWLNNTSHLYIGSEEIQTEIACYIASIGKKVYSSDIEMIETWM